MLSIFALYIFSYFITVFVLKIRLGALQSLVFALYLPLLFGMDVLNLINQMLGFRVHLVVVRTYRRSVTHKSNEPTVTQQDKDEKDNTGSDTKNDPREDV
jgi:positive regulator of sigma E activity